jgi:hypothetical protein
MEEQAQPAKFHDGEIQNEEGDAKDQKRQAVRQ